MLHHWRDHLALSNCISGTSSSGASNTANTGIDVFDLLSRPPVQGHMALNIPLPRSDTESPNRGGTDLEGLPNVNHILPPLPEIRSGPIRKSIFTQSSNLAKDHKQAFQAPDGDVPLDNKE